jgi:hypothetical protein
LDYYTTAAEKEDIYYYNAVTGEKRSPEVIE